MILFLIYNLIRGGGGLFPNFYQILNEIQSSVDLSEVYKINQPTGNTFLSFRNGNNLGEMLETLPIGMQFKRNL